MARPQQFEYDQVLNDAMQLFWRKGYVATSVKELTEATSLQPGSLYGTFKSKRKLFLQSLDFYFAALYSKISKILHSEKSPLERIDTFFDYFINQANNDEDRKSCLLVNTLLEVPPDDKEIIEQVSRMFLKVENDFLTVLQEAQKQGELSSESDIKALAKMLMSGIFGLQVYNRMQPDKKSLQEITKCLLSSLKK